MIDPLDPGTFELKLPAQPMSNTERQRKLRQERAKAGIKPVYISPAERELLGQALRLLGRVRGAPENISGDVVELLQRVQPDGPQDEKLDDCALPSVACERDDLARDNHHLREDREQLRVALVESRRVSYEREQALQRTLAETEAWGEHYRRQRDGKQAEVENLLGVLGELQALAEELGGPSMKMEQRRSPAVQVPPTAEVDLAQLNEDELELLKGALSEHHEKNKHVLWKDVACESLWKRLSLLQLNQMEPRPDPFARWGDDPVWSKASLQTAAADARKALVEGLAQPAPEPAVTRNGTKRAGKGVV